MPSASPTSRTSHSSLSGAQPDSAAIVQGLRRIVRALQAYSHEVQHEYGLTAPQLWVLKTLQREGDLPAGRLASRLAVHQSSMSLLLDRLEGRGFIRRVRSKTDRRSVVIGLTDRGATLAGKAPEPAQGRLMHGLRALGPAEVRGIRRSVERLVELMEASDVEARFFFSED
jgi:DNA-binding MarR family transcriptional regulator